MTQKTRPFQISYTESVPKILGHLRISLALTTYQAGKLIFISPTQEGRLIQLPRTFEKPMGIGLSEDNNELCLATLKEVIRFKDSSELAYHYPNKKKTYDHLFVPRIAYYTNALDLHDIAILKDKIYAVNTLFNCIVEIDHEYSFKPFWKPDFINSITAEDRCHLNGMAIEDRKIKYATAFSKGNTKGHWREQIPNSGIVFDLEQNAILTENIFMPHSPKLYEGQLYVLSSVTGELFRIDRENGNTEAVLKAGGFVRGLYLYKDFAFIGHSHLRKSSKTFSKLDIPKKEQWAGISIWQLSTGKLVGKIRYESSVEEIYEVMGLPEMVRPNILNTVKPEYMSAIMLPNKTFWGEIKKDQ